MNADPGHVLSLPNSAKTLEENKALCTAKAKILVVDDEPSICKFARFILEESDYQVETCLSGIDALALINEQPSRFDLAILDLSMPVMNGEVLMQKLYGLRISMKIIVSSGHQSRLPAEELHRLGVVALMPKPYSVDDLCCVVKSTLGR
jgi:DNA-binding NtrC family response regulator